MAEWGLNSINKHKAVHVLHSFVFEPWTDTFSHTDNPDIWHARVGILVETSSEMLCSVRLKELTKAKP